MLQEGQPNLLLKAFPQNDKVVMEEEEGWISYYYEDKEERPAFAYKVNKDGAESVSFLTALVPVDGMIEKELSDSVTAKVSKRSKNSYTYTITLGDKTRTVEVDLGNQ
jgi:hypothetical protein